MTPVQNLLAKLPGAKKCAGGWSARCPAHEDRHASLSVSAGDDGTALVRCHAGCETAAVLAAIDLKLADLFARPTDRWPADPKPARPKAKPAGTAFPTAEAAVANLTRKQGKPSRVWTYRDAAGEPVGLVARWDGPDGKDIRPVALHADGWRVGAMPAPRPLYNLPDLAAASRVVVTEGEPAADAARYLGFTAITSAGGAQAAGKTDWRPLAGKDVLVFPDNDDPGRKYATDVADVLTGLSPRATVRVVELPGLPDKGDLLDWIDAHGEAAEPDGMRAEIEALIPVCDPPPADPPLADPPAADWPAPLAPAAFHGLAGRFVRTVEPHT